MASLIDYTYFINKLSLAQATNTEGRTVIQNFIDIYEPELLKKLLGYDLYKAFITGIAPAEPAQKWKDIRDGKDFTYSDRTRNWNGFKTTAKISPIANYVFYKFLEHWHSNASGIGVVQSKPENSEVVLYSKKMIDSWNSMVDMVYELKLFLNLTENREVYPEWQKNSQRADVYKKLNLLSI